MRNGGEVCTDFKSDLKKHEKMHPEKVISQKLCQTVIEVEKIITFPYFFP
jgi:hypothetical protein